MTISYPVTPPATPLPRDVRVMADNQAAMSESIFTGQQWTYQHPKQRWLLEMTLPPMTRTQAQPWESFLLSLNGRAGTFVYSDPSRRRPLGTGGGTPLMQAAASARATSISTKGWTPGAKVMLAGDRFQLGSGSTARLHAALADVTADPSGNAIFDLWPATRYALAVNAPITVINPVGLWRLAENLQGWQVGEALMSGMTISAVEAL